ncbi:endoribonuclease L-PSP family protein [Ochrobactrum quorumnocens]|uniref:Endoribonuclease L-PSP family protein n=1 Tax=Ochrobactrum quorumnocens TaxID=271865 RepID=A0A248ULY5_9HYPH|nr:endoribonuclease L-PSP family protein [[Ochrobactrum] quorumnocens]
MAFDNLKAALDAVGCTFDDLVDVTTFHTDPESQFATIMEVRRRIFTKPPYPNWTVVGVNWLAGFDYEIKVIARLPESN